MTSPFTIVVSHLPVPSKCARNPAINIRPSVRSDPTQLHTHTLGRVSRCARLNDVVEHKHGPDGSISHRVCNPQSCHKDRFNLFPSSSYISQQNANPIKMQEARGHHSRQKLQSTILPRGDIQSTDLPVPSRPLNPLAKVQLTFILLQCRARPASGRSCPVGKKQAKEKEDLEPGGKKTKKKKKTGGINLKTAAVSPLTLRKGRHKTPKHTDPKHHPHKWRSSRPKTLRETRRNKKGTPKQS